jgi:hypothetical protein
MHFPKPVDIETLRKVLARMLARAEEKSDPWNKSSREPVELV